MSPLLRRLAAAVLALITAPAVAGELPTVPVPALETGMHGAALNRIDIHHGRLATVADDKTLRLWRLEDGTLEATVRVPVGAGNEGKLYAVAAQPGGKLVAVGGWTGVEWDGGSFFYIVDAEKGRVFGRVGPFTSTINHMAFSGDGRYLAVAFSAGEGVRVFDLKANKPVFHDASFKDAVTWAAFAVDGRLAVASLDGTVRLYDAVFQTQASLRAPSRRQPFSLSFAPDGTELAVGYLDGAGVTLHETRGLKQTRELQRPKGRSGGLSVVLHGGGEVLAGGTLGTPDGRRYVVRWRGGERQEIAVGTDTVVDLRLLDDGRVAFATADPAWGLIDGAGFVTLRRDRGFADFRDGYKESFALSADGGVVRFGLRQGGQQPATFDLLERSLDRQPSAAALRPPLERTAALKPDGWRNGTAPTINGRPVRLEPNEVARSVAVAAQGTRWLLGTDFYLRAYDGDRLLWKVATPAPAWMVGLAGDVALAGMGDGTLRWYGLDDGAERLALFVHADAKRWIAWTPEGFFDHSADGDRLFGYLLNRAKNRDAEFVDAAQLYGSFFRRDLVVKRFQGGFETEIADQLARIGDVRTVLGKGLPPTLEVVEYCLQGVCQPVDAAYIMRGTTQGTRAIEITQPEVVLKVRQVDRGGGIGRLIVRRNGAAVAAGQTRATAADGAQVETVRLALQPGENEVNLSVTNASGQIETNALEQVTVRIRLAAADSTLPRLHVLAIGIDAYQRPELKLANARSDAEAISTVLRDTRHVLYREAIITTLVDQDATSAGIAAAFQRLGQEVAPADVVLVFFAGHGIALDGQYYFIPQDLPATTPAAIVRHGFSQQKLAEMLAGLTASRVVLMVDTCFAGSIDVGDIARRARDQTWVESLSRSTGRFTLASTTNEQEALDGLNGNGVFTGVVLKALAGDADIQVSGDKDGKVNVYELARYAKVKVPEAVRQVAPQHKQEPTYHFAGSDFFDISAVE